MTMTADWLNVIELREYTLYPGKRDVLIELFDHELVDTQEAAGIRVLGQFRDLHRPDRFVWLRGFSSMEGRASALAEFYGGPIWRKHRAAANATMVNSDNVLLLRPAWVGSIAGLCEAPASEQGALVVVTVYSLVSSDALEDFSRCFREELQPVLSNCGIPVMATLKTEPAANTFPALPVREGEHTFVWLSGFIEQATFVEKLKLDRFAAAFALLRADPVSFFLEPTSGSRRRRRSENRV